MNNLPKVAVIVLNYNTTHMTKALENYLMHQDSYPNKDVYVIDNGSSDIYPNADLRLDTNLGFTVGMYEGYKFAKSKQDYDAYWFCNSDIGFEYGNDVLSVLVNELYSNNKIGIISPQVNSPYPFMAKPNGDYNVPFIEFIAPVITKELLDTIGFWDLDFKLGYGVDYDYGSKVRKAGFKNAISVTAKISHKEHKSIPNFKEYQHNASQEMHHLLREKHGANWYYELISSHSLNKIQPLILTCPKPSQEHNTFLDSYKTKVLDFLPNPIVVCDTTKYQLTESFKNNITSKLYPSLFIEHPREVDAISDSDSIERATMFSLKTAIDNTNQDIEYILFLEDDVLFSSQFVSRLQQEVELMDYTTGMITLYSPGNTFCNRIIDPNSYYGTQAVLFPKHVVKSILKDAEFIWANFPALYDIRWSRYIGHIGLKILSTQQSYVQHLGIESRIHNNAPHQTSVFVP